VVTLEISSDPAQAVYKHIYPIILCGPLGLYTFKASTYAFANNIGLLALSKSERGVHGGIYQEPLVIFSHDVIHHKYIIPIEDSVLAARFFKFSRYLFEIINTKIPEIEQEYYFFGAHMILHENIYPQLSKDNKINLNPTLSEIIDYCFCGILKTSFTDLLLTSDIEPYEHKLRMLENSLFLAEKSNNSNKIKDLKNKMNEIENYKKQSKIEDVVKTGGNDPFCYDIIESLLYVTGDPEKKRTLEARILPGFGEFSKNLSIELKKKYSIYENTDKDSEKYKNYLQDYYRQLYKYKTHNFNTLEVYKALREYMIGFRNKVKPYLEEIDLKQGHVSHEDYQSVWEKGLAT
jgi:hypothetical protein